MANWRQYDKLENTMAWAGAELAEFCSALIEISPERRAEVMLFAQAVIDSMCAGRKAAQDKVVAERGWRR